jgi:hypothetical protein
LDYLCHIPAATSSGRGFAGLSGKSSEERRESAAESPCDNLGGFQQLLQGGVVGLDLPLDHAVEEGFGQLEEAAGVAFDDGRDPLSLSRATQSARLSQSR